MRTRYLTFILRLRLEEERPRETGGQRVVGSVQRVGLEEIRYFDSPEKLHEALERLSTWAAADPPAVDQKEKK